MDSRKTTGGAGDGSVAVLQALSPRGERLHSELSTLFCCALIVSNVLAVKALDLGLFALPAFILTFPLVYIINEVLLFPVTKTVIVRALLHGRIAALASGCLCYHDAKRTIRVK